MHSHTLTALCTLSLAHLAFAAVGNLTLTFYTTDGTAGCGARSQGISLTTESVPYAYTCLNVADLFAQGDTNGVQLGNGAGQFNNSGLELGVNYTLTNLDSFDSSGNYSQIAVQQVNITSEQAGEGKPAGRNINVYSLRDCQQTQGDDPTESHPWYEQSCQTSATGQCHELPFSIQSFSIQQEELPDGDAACRTWAYLGAGSRASRTGIWAVGGLAAIVAVWTML